MLLLLLLEVTGFYLIDIIVMGCRDDAFLLGLLVFFIESPSLTKCDAFSNFYDLWLPALFQDGPPQPLLLLQGPALLRLETRIV